MKSPGLFFIVVFMVFISAFSEAQLPVQWVRNFKPQGLSADRIYKIHADAQGNVYVAGYAGGLRGYGDAFAMKRNAQGDTLWTYYYNGPGNEEDHATDMFVDTAGNVYLTGQSTAAAISIHECITIKLNSLGTEQWVNRYSPTGTGNSEGNSIVVDSVGNVYVAGFYDAPLSSTDWLVIKYNSQGVQQWVDQFNGSAGDDEAFEVVIAPNGNATVCGIIGPDAFIKQYSSGGGLSWSDTWTNPNFSGYDKAVGMRFIPNGDLIVGGESNIGPGANRDAFAVSYSSAGSFQWNCIYSDATTTRDEFFNGIAVDDSGNCYLTGSDFFDNITIRINGDGTKGWRNKWSGPSVPSRDGLNDIALDTNGGVYTTGRGIYPGPDYFTNGGTDNMIVIKYSTGGDSLWTRRISKGADVSAGSSMDIKNGNVYIGGSKGDTADVNFDHYVWVMDTAGTTLNEWQFNGAGEGKAKGQFVRCDAQNNVYSAATVDRLTGYLYGYDIVVIKYNPVGDLLWERYYPSRGLNNDTLTGFEIDPFGNLFLSVSSDTNALSQGYRMSLVKMNAGGEFLDTLWITGATFSNSFVRCMKIRNDGSIVIGGNASGLGGFVAFIDDQFTQQWIAQMDSTPLATTRVNGISIFTNGDFAIGGYSMLGSFNLAKGILQRFDASGNRIWTVDVDSVNVADDIMDVSVNNAGNVALTGSSGQTSMTEMHNGINGQFMWRGIYNPNTVSEYGMKVRNSNQGNTVVLCRGYTGFVPRFTNIQYDGTTGAQQWANAYSPVASTREPVDMLVEPSGRVVAAGYEINGSTVDVNCTLVGYTTSGVQTFVNTYTTAGSHPEQWYSLARDSQGDFALTGGTSADFLNEYIYHILTVKYGGSAVGVEEINQLGKLIVFPNPSESGKFYLEDNSYSSPITKFQVYTITGQKIMELDNFENEIDLSKYIVGCYLLKFERENLSYGTIKLIR